MSKPSPLAPRKRSMYDSRQHGGSESRLMPGNKCLDTALGAVQLVSPQGDKGQCLFRPWPAPSLEDPNVPQGCRQADDPNRISEWGVKVMAARFIGMGDDKRTFLCYLSGDQAGAEASPYCRFYWACYRAKKAGKFHGSDNMEWKGTWNKYIGQDAGGGKGKGGPPITPLTGLWHYQGHVYVNGEQKYMTAERNFVPLGLGDNDPLPIIQVSEHCGDGLRDLVMLANESWDGNDPAAMYKYDPIGVYDADSGTMVGGLMVGVYKPNVTKLPVPPGTKDPKNPGKPHPQLTPTSWDGTAPKSANFWGYETYLRRAYVAEKGQPTLTGAMDAAQTATMLSKYRYWFPDPDDKNSHGVLRILTAPEQMREIAEAFSAEPKLVRFALEDDDELFTDEINGILNHKKTFVNPGVAKVKDEAPDPEADPDAQPEAEAPAAKPKATKDVVAPPGDIHDYASEYGGDPAAPAEEEPDAEAAAEGDDAPVDETPVEDVPAEGEAEGGDPEANPEAEPDPEATPEPEAVDPDADPDGGAEPPPPPPAPKQTARKPAQPVKVGPPVGKASDKTLFDGDPDAPAPIEGGDEADPEAAAAAETDAKMQQSLAKVPKAQPTPQTNAAAGRAAQRKGPAAPPAPPAKPAQAPAKPATAVAKPTNRPAPVAPPQAGKAPAAKPQAGKPAAVAPKKK